MKTAAGQTRKPNAFIRHIGDSVAVSFSDNPSGYVYLAHLERGMDAPGERAAQYLNVLAFLGYATASNAGR